MHNRLELSHVDAMRLVDAARADLREQGIADVAIAVAPRARLRFEGSDSTLTLDVTDAASMDAAFRKLHRQRFGYSDETAPIMLEALSVEASGNSGGLDRAQPLVEGGADSQPGGQCRTITRSNMSLGEIIEGPALVIDPSRRLLSLVCSEGTMPR